MIVITTLAEYQTRFWIKVACALKNTGNEVVLLSFDDRSSELINQSGLISYNVPALAKGVNNVPLKSYQEVLGSYGLEDINYWISHERVTFSLKDTNKMIARLISYIQVVDKINDTTERGSGGFGSTGV